MSIYAKSRGIALIIALVIMVFLVMFASAFMVLITNQQRQAKYIMDEFIAQRAAESGINYAMARLAVDNDWSGCEQPTSGRVGNSFDLISSGAGLEVHEHVVKDTLGCVEGKLKVGEEYGYFDMYFQKPVNDTSMYFFKTAGEAVPLPDSIILCYNNNAVMAPMWCFDSSGNRVPGRTVPQNAVLLVCRGTAGSVTRTIEVCVRLVPDNSNNTVVIGRGALTINLHGTSELEKIVLELGPDQQASIMRSVGAMLLGVADGNQGAYPTADYLQIAQNCGGVCNTAPAFSPFSPLEGATAFRQEAGQESYIPVLTMDRAMPPTSSIKSTFEAGTYFVGPRDATDPLYNRSPLVWYYKTDDPAFAQNPPPNLPAPSRIMTAEFDQRVAAGEIAWDPGTRKLMLLESHEVTSVADRRNVLRNFILGSVPGERVTMQLGRDPAVGTKPPTIYLTNDEPNGSIFIDGQLSGIGTVTCSGNLDVEAESQLAANDINGISVYAGGTIRVNEMDENPFITKAADNVELVKEYNIKQSIWRKIQQVGKSNRWRISGQYPVGRSLFSEEECNYLDGTIPAPKGVTVSLFSPDPGDPLKESVWVNRTIDTPVTNNGVTYYPLNDADGDGGSMILEKLFDRDDLIETKRDKKGRLIDARDSVFRGLVYACRDFIVASPNHSFVLEGGLVAFGGDMNGNPSTGGNITMDISDGDFRYDTRYLAALSADGKKHLDILYWVIDPRIQK